MTRGVTIATDREWPGLSGLLSVKRLHSSCMCACVCARLLHHYCSLSGPRSNGVSPDSFTTLHQTSGIRDGGWGGALGMCEIRTYSQYKTHAVFQCDELMRFKARNVLSCLYSGVNSLLQIHMNVVLMVQSFSIDPESVQSVLSPFVLFLRRMCRCRLNIYIFVFCLIIHFFFSVEEEKKEWGI